ncbi:MOSC domain-containing protein [Nocardiopsis sp. FIRDI 009]|uniref:MOSC domain-containing protein n=1 Tax=Nocardiopsis sp. FIRDI 009 TaxID=714197 RepID=UPI000E25A508|nr:MOSC domain-containing protein [Nocardiopsis sp. FIRDI 009]
MADGRLARLVRYPVKGLAGVEIASARVEPGRGLPGDRLLALARAGAKTSAPWRPREEYLHLARDAYLGSLDVRDPGHAPVVVGVPGEGEFAASPGADGDALGDAVASLAGTGGPRPRLVGAPVGQWDWPSAHLSVVNLATVRQLSAAAGVEISPERFRANLYLDGLRPWEELSWVGGRIEVSGAVLRVVQPTDRCRATAVRPGSGVEDLNVPALLASGFGHGFCGVYARVEAEGTIEAGAPVTVTPGRGREAAPSGATPSWPRAATVARTVRESADVRSVWLADPLGGRLSPRPGQHLRVHRAWTGSPGWRCYTVSAVEGGHVRVSVRLDGAVSTWVHGLREGDRVTVTGPFGESEPDLSRTRDLLLYSAGVGITPTVAWLRHLARTPDPVRVRVVHVERRADELALWDEVCEAVAALPDARARLFLTGEDDRNALRALGARSGRPARADLAADVADPCRTEARLCGPRPFVGAVRSALIRAGVPDAAVRTESFTAPRRLRTEPPRAPATPGPHTVRLGGDRLTWTAGAGSLLEAAEAAGLSPAHACRVGACGTCVRPLHSGRVEYLVEPTVDTEPDEVLLCCAAPLEDVEVGP